MRHPGCGVVHGDGHGRRLAHVARSVRRSGAEGVAAVGHGRGVPGDRGRGAAGGAGHGSVDEEVDPSDGTLIVGGADGDGARTGQARSRQGSVHGGGRGRAVHRRRGDAPGGGELLDLGGQAHGERVELTELSQEQADYIGVPKAGPFKPDHYRY